MKSATVAGGGRVEAHHIQHAGIVRVGMVSIRTALERGGVEFLDEGGAGVGVRFAVRPG